MSWCSSTTSRVALEDLLADGDERQPAAAALLLLRREDSVRRVAGSSKRSGASEWTRPPANMRRRPGSAGRGCPRTGWPSRPEVGLRGAVEQVDPVPEQRQFAPRASARREAGERLGRPALDQLADHASNSSRIDALCWPSAGTSRISGSRPRTVTGGTSAWMGPPESHGPPAVARLELRVLGELVGRAHACARDPGPSSASEQLVGGLIGERRLEDRGQLVVVLDPLGLRAKRGSSTSSGRSRTSRQSVAHSRSFCTPR